MKTPEGVSLLDELETLVECIDSAALLAEMLSTDSVASHAERRDLPRLLVSLLTLTESRLRLLRRVVLQQVTPDLLKTRRNVRGEVEAHEDPDVVLLPVPIRPPRRRGR
jgi:hypothetical protein